MKKKDEDRSELMLAAEALDRELTRFGDIARQIQKEPLGSQKHLDRVVGFFKQLAEAEATLQPAMKVLSDALDAARRRQQEQVEAVNERAKALEERLASLRELQARYEGLGQVALQVNQALVALGGKKLAENGDKGEVAAVLPELIASLARATDAAQDLVAAAEERGFPDLARDAGTLRQQILAAQNKLNLLQKKLGGGV